MGPPLAAQKTFAKAGAKPTDLQVNAFFPTTTTIHVGDKVTFVPTGFHNLDIPKKGGSGVALFAPTGTKAAGANDAAGNPFWFNGQDLLGFSPALLKSSFGKSFAYTGAAAVQSGLPLATYLKPVTVTFKKAGTVTYLCDIHPGMKGTVKVLAKSKAIPSPRADAQAVDAQIAKDLTILKDLAKKSVPANTFHLGEAGAGGTEYFDFLPNTMTVPVGTTVKFEMTAKSFEAHTATAGPGDPENAPDSYLGKLAASLEAPSIDPAALYPSDVAPVSLTSTTHGNGFWSSGSLDSDAKSTPPGTSSVTIGAPGTYKFYCLIHPFMVGTVIAQ